MSMMHKGMVIKRPKIADPVMDVCKPRYSASHPMVRADKAGAPTAIEILILMIRARYSSTTLCCTNDCAAIDDDTNNPPTKDNASKASINSFKSEN